MMTAIVLPVTGFYASLLALLVIVLLLTVVRKRFRHRVGVGHGGHGDLQLAIRAHANAIETIPLALILLAAFEANAAPLLSLHIFGGVLLIGRLLHAWGLSHHGGVSFYRFWGTICTVTVMLGLALANIWMFFHASVLHA